MNLTSNPLFSAFFSHARHVVLPLIAGSFHPLASYELIQEQKMIAKYTSRTCERTNIELQADIPYYLSCKAIADTERSKILN